LAETLLQRGGPNEEAVVSLPRQAAPTRRWIGVHIDGGMKGFLRDNGLSLVLVALFVLFFVGQAVSGWLNYSDEQDEHHQPQIGFAQYLTTGAFGEAVFEN
jgi:hypothetical protein